MMSNSRYDMAQTENSFNSGAGTAALRCYISDILALHIFFPSFLHNPNRVSRLSSYSLTI
jgi:hypothetical protein